MRRSARVLVLAGLSVAVALTALGCGSSDSGAPEAITDGDADSETADTQDGDLDTQDVEETADEAERVVDGDTTDGETGVDGDTDERDGEADTEVEEAEAEEVEAEEAEVEEAEAEEVEAEEAPSVTYYRDDDEDGFGQSADHKELSAPNPPYTATVGDDCDDGNSAIHPGATEICDTKDNDCNEMIDDGIAEVGTDCVSGNWGVCSAGKMLCLGGQLGCKPTIMPGSQSEICDNLDNDCDGATDEDLSCTKGDFD